MQYKKLFLAAPLLIIMAGCNKEIHTGSDPVAPTRAGSVVHGHLKQTSTYSSEVAIKWMNMQTRLMAATTGVANVAFSRPYAYSGIALYEAVVPGMPAYQSLASQLNGLTGLPQTEPGLAYNWAVSANAALASVNKKMFPAASVANKAAVDSLENALNAAFSENENPETISRSIAFGKSVAQKIYEWSETDNYLHASDTYTAPAGPGLWVAPSAPVPATSTPFWGNLRPMVAGSGHQAQPPAPVSYSELPSSAFYKMVRQVYDASQSLAPADIAMALYWRDVPGLTTPGHYVSILRQVLENNGSMLDQAAYAYALGGITVYDAAISCWQSKFHFNLVRPISYIRNVLGYTTWSPLLATPAHPEYSSAHAVLSTADAEALTAVFGNQSFTDHSYDYLGMAPRSFNTFRDFGKEAGNSRLYAGIHYQPSIDAGAEQGKKVAANIIATLKFKKE